MNMSICENCGDEFEQKNKYRESKTCSRDCRYALSAKSNREAQGARYLGRECPQCGNTFDGKTTYCSRTCSNKSRAGDEHPARQVGRPRVQRFCKVCGADTENAQRATCPEHRQRQTVRVLATCPCGQPAENIRSKYCGEEHRRKWGTRPAARTVTKTCLGCGEEFTRPHYYPGKMKYCSNKCAHREQKMTTEVGALLSNDRTLIFRSTWEMRFYCVCLRFDIPIRSYDGPDIETSEGIYRPDFIVNDDRIIDVKGWLRPESEQKVIDAREQGVDVHVVDKEDLAIMEAGADLSALILNRASTLQ